MTGIGRFQGLTNSTEYLNINNNEKTVGKLLPTDSKIKKTYAFSKNVDSNGEAYLKLNKFSNLSGKKGAEILNQFEKGDADILVIENRNGKDFVRNMLTGEEMDVKYLEIHSVNKNGVEKVKYLAREHFQIERMDADEYAQIRSVVQSRLQVIVDQAKKNEEKQEESLTDRVTIGGKRNLNGSHKAKAISRTISSNALNQNATKDEVAKATQRFYVDKANREKRKREEHEEAAKVIREAVENDEMKRETRIKEVDKQENRLSTFKAEDNPKPPHDMK